MTSFHISNRFRVLLTDTTLKTHSNTWNTHKHLNALLSHNTPHTMPPLHRKHAFRTNRYRYRLVINSFAKAWCTQLIVHNPYCYSYKMQRIISFVLCATFALCVCRVVTLVNFVCNVWPSYNCSGVFGMHLMIMKLSGAVCSGDGESQARVNQAN